MSVKWREGINVEVKERVIALITSVSIPGLLDEELRYLRHSQFFKVCINQFGSKSQSINEAFKDQQKFYNKIVMKKCQQMSINISQFVFGFRLKKKQSKEGTIFIRRYPPTVNTVEEFKRQLDQYIERQIKGRMHALYQKFSNKRLAQLKVRIAELSKRSCENEEQYNRNLQDWQECMAQAMDFNCFSQILADINVTYRNIMDFKSNFSKKVVAIHAGKVLENLYKYSLTHQETEYNI